MMDNRKAITIEVWLRGEWRAFEAWNSLLLAIRRVEKLRENTACDLRLVWTETGEPLP